MGKRLLILALALLVVMAAIALTLGYGQSNPQNQAALENPAPVVYTLPPGCGMLSVHVLNVSQADAIVIVTPSNKTILIDSGSGMKKDSAARVVESLHSMGIAKIDYVIATHYHEDHIGGMEDVESGFGIGTLYHNGNCGGYNSAGAQKLVEYAQSHDATIVTSDMDLPEDPCLAQARLIVAYDRPAGCWPSGTESSDENDNSILLRLAYGNTSFLFAGDCEAGCEAELLRQGTFLRSDVLKAGHHGSGTSSTDAFLAAVGAEYYVISTDKTRSVADGYYHPRQPALARIFAHGGEDTTYRTDLDGDVDILSDGRSITVLPQAAASACDIFSGYASAEKSSYGRISSLAACN
jgi:competence protein ComEC